MKLQQYLPFTVLKRFSFKEPFYHFSAVATVLTVHGIETKINWVHLLSIYEVATVPTVHGIETRYTLTLCVVEYTRLQQSIPFTVCAEGGETAEEPSDDEVRPSQVPEQSEGKTKVIRQQSLPFTVLKQAICLGFDAFECVATAPTVYGIETH